MNKSILFIVASRTIWFGRIPTTCYESDIQQAIKDTGVAEKINIVAPRGCAYVTMSDRRSAFKIMDRMSNNLQVCKKSVKVCFFILWIVIRTVMH
jgi:RNA recognition motif-containing protein